MKLELDDRDRAYLEKATRDLPDRWPRANLRRLCEARTWLRRAPHGSIAVPVSEIEKFLWPSVPPNELHGVVEVAAQQVRREVVVVAGAVHVLLGEGWREPAGDGR